MQVNEAEIVSAALEIVDAGGLGALSMRKLAAKLKCDPMAVYYYLPSKEALLDAVAARLDTEGSPPETWRDLHDALESFAQRQMAVAIAHPLAVPIFALRPSNNPSTGAAYKWLAARLREAGIAGDGGLKLFVAGVNGVLLYYHAIEGRNRNAHSVAKRLMSEMVSAICRHLTAKA